MSIRQFRQYERIGFWTLILPKMCMRQSGAGKELKPHCTLASKPWELSTNDADMVYEVIKNIAPFVPVLFMSTEGDAEDYKYPEELLTERKFRAAPNAESKHAIRCWRASRRNPSRYNSTYCWKRRPRAHVRPPRFSSPGLRSPRFPVLGSSALDVLCRVGRRNFEELVAVFAGRSSRYDDALGELRAQRFMSFALRNADNCNELCVVLVLGAAREAGQDVEAKCLASFTRWWSLTDMMGQGWPGLFEMMHRLATVHTSRQPQGLGLEGSQIGLGVPKLGSACNISEALGHLSLAASQEVRFGHLAEANHRVQGCTLPELLSNQGALWASLLHIESIGVGKASSLRF